MRIRASFSLTLWLALLLAPAVALAGSATAPAATGTTKITWHGHAAFEIVTPSGKVLMIDPWLTNPLNPNKDPVASVTKLDYILVTHGHSDHVGDAVALGKKTGARLVANFELAQNIARVQGYPENQMGFDTLGNPGGELTLEGGEVKVLFVPAIHSSGIDAKDAAGKPLPFAYGGNPVGFVVKIKDGPTLYHSGDTAFYSDMELISEQKPDLALLNLGGHFGMEADMAARAAKAVKAKTVVPHHYKTFPILTQDPKPFFAELDKLKIKYVDLQPGGTLVYKGRELQPPAKK